MRRYAIHSALLCAAVSFALAGQLFSQESKQTPSAVSVDTAASTPKNAPAVTFATKSRLVLVPVVVSRDGVPVTGLKKEDFRVMENGKEQKISVFEEVKTDATPVKTNVRRQPELRQFSNLQLDQDHPKRLVIIVLDLMNTPMHDREYARHELVKYLSSGIDKGALVSLVALGRGRIRIIHDFTSNPETLVAALKKVRGEPNSTEWEVPPTESKIFENEVNLISTFLESGRFSGARFGTSDGSSAERWLRIRETLDGMNLIAQAYAGVPGRKALIWATAGFPFQIDGSTMLLDPKKFGDPRTMDLSSILPYYEQTWRVMNNANFAIYPVDVRGLVTTNIGADQNVSGKNVVRQVQRNAMVHQDTISTFGTFADMTGGRAFYNTNDLAASFKEATVDSSSYYLLAYYMDEKDLNEKKKSWRSLKVKVDAPKVSVRARNGFFIHDDDAAAVRDEIELALSSPLDFTALPLTVRWLDQAQAVQTDPAKPAQKKVKFEVLLPANAVTLDTANNNGVSLKIVASARGADAVEVNGVSQTITGHASQQSIEQIRKAGFSYKSEISLPAGRYSVRFVVRDNVSGRTGSVAAPISVE